MSYGDSSDYGSTPRRSGGGGFDLSNYKTVAERLAEARKAYPEGRFQSEILPLSDELGSKYVAVKARFFRTPDDPAPGEGLAWEPVPGRTPYTKDSELQNAETSAWGRALVAAFVVDTEKGIASRDEVRNRRESPSRQRRSQPKKEQAPTAPTNGVAEQEEPNRLFMRGWLSGAKSRLLEATGGDKEKAKEVWASLLDAYRLSADEIPEISLHPKLEDALTIMISDLKPAPE